MGSGAAPNNSGQAQILAYEGSLYLINGANDIFALDVDTGKLAWYFQHAPGEALDLDVVFERVLVDDGNDNLLFTVGKDGILWKLDRGRPSSGRWIALTAPSLRPGPRTRSTPRRSHREASAASSSWPAGWRRSVGLRTRPGRRRR